jgi:hypothetical protein
MSDDYMKRYANMAGMDMLSLLKMAGFELLEVRELRNQYSTEFHNRPWFAVKTQHGVIILGWRKRVINIEWALTDFRGVVTPDDVTKENYLVHAHSYGKALEYLTILRNQMDDFARKDLTASGIPL